MRIGSTLVLVFAVCLVAPSATAQDATKVGITMAAPQSVGIIWQSRKFAVRPEVTFSGSSTSVSSPLSSGSSSSWNIGLGVSVLFYLHQYERLRTYIAPRFDYSHSATSIDISSTSAISPATSRWAAGGTGSFGAQYQIVDRFAVFGEAGFTFSHMHLPAIGTAAVGHSDAWGTRTAVGVIFYP
jgi:hypothetical protein